MFNIFLGLLLLISPILFLPLSVPALATLQWYQFGFFSNGLEVVQRQIFMYGIILLVIASLFDKPKRLFGDDWIRWLLLICFLNVWAYPITIKIFPTVFLGFLLYYLVSVCADVKNIRYFFMVIAFVSFINTSFSILQFFHIPFLQFKEGEIIGLMGYKTQLGIYEALALPICFVLNPWLTIIPVVGLLLANSATALVAGVAGMIYFLHKKGLRIKSIPIWQVFLVISGFYLWGHFEKLGIRFDAWKYALLTGINHWFHGNGIGLFSFIGKSPLVNDPNFAPKFTDPYSIYLEVFNAIGIFGLIAFLFFVGSKFIGIPRGNSEKLALFTSCLILAIVGFGYSFMDYPRLAGTAIVLFGLLTAIRKEGALF
jgi:hypothetical protein